MFSSDTKYIIKCITQNEFDVLQKILPNYYEYLIGCTIKNLQKNYLECQGSITIASTYCSSGLNQINNNKDVNIYKNHSRNQDNAIKNKQKWKLI